MSISFEIIIKGSTSNEIAAQEGGVEEEKKNHWFFGVFASSQ